ncbi:hypothetical protein F5Y16DRAFT_362383 [Xylariaceae sp. FL0255]|nr:hypothetical protein F5Y16DRAFT_362383 [Xylariaceae sp. FL0255]
MSSRQLRKLQKQKELEQLQIANPAIESDESDDAVPALSRPSKPSMFSGFAALGDEEDQDDDHGNENDDEPSAHPVAAPASTPGLPNGSLKKNKKKKKKARKSGASLSLADRATDKPKNVDEIDQALQELKLAEKKHGAASSSQADGTRSVEFERVCELLRINTQHLKVMNEMRNLFGREAIVAAQNEENEERARAQRPRQISQQVDLETFLKGQPGKTLPEVTLRRNPFLPGKDTWPRASTEGLTMHQIKDGVATSGTIEFGFVHDEGYNSLETQFFGLVQLYDPMRLVHFLYRHPYHISTLIQVSKVAKQDQNSALSADLCERALFTFGRVSLSAFRQKLEEGKARLDFRRPENRQFWLAGYHYLKSLVMKGTYRTALEWSKLLFSMDLSDPYGIVHFIHPMAVRAHESKWFIDFCASQALDKFDTMKDYIRQTLVLAKLQLNDAVGAKALLVQGMDRLPWLYSSIYKAVNLDVPRAIWGVQPRNRHEELFTELYIHQTKSLWDNTQALDLLKQVSLEVKRPDNQTFDFPPTAGRNVARFVYLDNTPSLMSHVPDGLLSTSPNWEFDPLPPLLEENVFSYETQKLPWSSDRARRNMSTEGQLRRVIERMHRGGGGEDAADNMERLLDEVMADVAFDDRNGDDDGSGEGNDGDNEGGLLNMIMEFFNRTRSNQGQDDDSLDEQEARMPGAWAYDTDDTMPRDYGGDTTDDEMPGLEE